MEAEKSLVKASEVKLPAFVENAYQTIEGMREFSNMLLESRLLPNHFYEQGPDKKPDYTKGKTSSVTLVLLQAQQLQIPPMTALQHIIPVNGLLSIKGDLAKTMIFSSGKLKRDSWMEESTGSVEQENLVVTITATREDNGVTMSRSFSVDRAKRAGLWITSQQVNGQDGWKYKTSAWYKYPDRMVGYRALGFIARDLFADVLNNMYTTEEAMDIPKDQSEIIDTADGAKIIIPDKQFAQGRSESLTERASKKIAAVDKKFEKVGGVQDAVIVPPDVKAQQEFIPERGSFESMGGQEVRRDEPAQDGAQEQIPGAGSENEPLSDLDKLDQKALMEIVNKDTDLIEACEMIAGKNTQKKLREIISAQRKGELAVYVAAYLEKNKDSQPEPPQSPAQGSEGAGGMPVNKDFENQGPEKKDPAIPASGNKYNMFVPEFDKGEQRDFGTMKLLFNSMASVNPSLNNPRYMELAGKTGLLAKYADREAFCKFASVEEINTLLNEN